MPQGWYLIFSGLVGGLLGAAIVSIVNIYLNCRLRKKEHSREYLNECIQLLQRAYEIFTSQGDSPPKNDRTLWGTAAIMILRFQDMKKRVAEDAHKVIVHEHEEYWRQKFASVLRLFEPMLDESYFAPKGWKDVRTRISRRSIAVVLDFADWSEGTLNPMKKVDYKSLLARLRVTSYPNLVDEILDGHPEDREEVQKLIDAYCKKHKDKFSWYFQEK